MRFNYCPILILSLIGVCSLGCSVVGENTIACVQNLDASLQEVAADEAITVDWSGLTETLDGDTMDPTDLVGLAVAWFEMSPSEATQELCNGRLSQSDVWAVYADPSIAGYTSAEMPSSGPVGLTMTISASSEAEICSSTVAVAVEDSTNTFVTLKNGGAVPQLADE